MSGSNDMHAQTYAKTHARPWHLYSIWISTVRIRIQNLNIIEQLNEQKLVLWQWYCHRRHKNDHQRRANEPHWLNVWMPYLRTINRSQWLETQPRQDRRADSAWVETGALESHRIMSAIRREAQLGMHTRTHAMTQLHASVQLIYFLWINLEIMIGWLYCCLWPKSKNK